MVSPDTGAAEPWTVTVAPGSALSSCGDDVFVAYQVRIDVRQPSRAAVTLAFHVDPWCAPVRQRREPERTYFLTIRSAEELRRPVRGSSCGCGCGCGCCEYSRVAETYTLAVLEDLPECYQDSEGGAAGGTARVSGFACTPEIEEPGTRMDVSVLRTALAQAGGDPDAVERIHELAGLAVRMARTS